jgi:ADP-ribose pyrophosphatase
MQHWRTRSRRTVLDLSPWVSVETHVVELPNGQVIEDWPWLESRDYVNVVALTEDESFLFFRQTKYAVRGTTLAPIGGYLEAGEEPLATARRELLEESGYEADDWTSLGQYVVDGNRGFGMGHLYVAQSARRVTDPAADDLEEQQLLTLTRAEVEDALLAGEFKVVSWVATVALALLATRHG